MKYCSTVEEKFRISARPCSILYFQDPVALMLDISNETGKSGEIFSFFLSRHFAETQPRAFHCCGFSFLSVLEDSVVFMAVPNLFMLCGKPLLFCMSGFYPIGDSPKKWRGCSSYLLGGKIWKSVPLRVLESKMTPARVVTVPFRGL